MSAAVEALWIGSPAGLGYLIRGLMPTSLVGGPQPLHARQGREMQRYNQEGARLVAGCIPVRVSKVNGKVEVDVCMITSRGGKGMVFPKVKIEARQIVQGGWEADETVEAAAARETVEEAGVRGVLEDDMVGAYLFSSSKAARKQAAANGPLPAEPGRCVAHMFVMHVAEELPTWPEGKERKRIWCSAEKAVELCRHDWMREALKAWLQKQNISF